MKGQGTDIEGVRQIKPLGIDQHLICLQLSLLTGAADVILFRYQPQTDLGARLPLEGIAAVPALALHKVEPTEMRRGSAGGGENLFGLIQNVS